MKSEVATPSLSSGKCPVHLNAPEIISDNKILLQFHIRCISTLNSMQVNIIVTVL